MPRLLKGAPMLRVGRVFLFFFVCKAPKTVSNAADALVAGVNDAEDVVNINEAKERIRGGARGADSIAVVEEGPCAGSTCGSRCSRPMLSPHRYEHAPLRPPATL